MDREFNATFTAAAQATGWISPAKNKHKQLNLSIDCSSDWSGTIILQRSKDDGVTAKNVSSFTEDIETNVTDAADGVLYRLYCSVYAAGEADVSLYR
jgi:hypothetical protein